MKSSVVAPLAILALPVLSSAQPRVVTLVQPRPNPAGWINASALVRYICEELANCPAAREISTEGPGQIVVDTVSDAQGQETRSEVIINLDRTPPDVVIQSPADASVTTAPSVRVSARAFDGLSGLHTAMCNGHAARVLEGQVGCVVSLAPGANDIVVDVSDLAGNSGAAGFRIFRTGKPTTLRILPDELSMLVGRERTLQVVDEFGMDVPDVLWRVDNYRLLEISNDGGHVVTPKAPGVATVTAMRDGLSVDARVSVYVGSDFPPRAVTWRVSGLSVTKMPDTSQRPRPPDASEAFSRYVMQPKMKPPQLLEIGQLTGRVSWMATPAVAEDEQVLSMITHRIGGAVMVVESTDGVRSSLVRAGPMMKGSPWRYRSPGRLSDKLTQDAGGTLLVVETETDGFPRVLIVDGMTGRVRNRLQINPGSSIVRNVGCIPRAHAARDLPPAMGPATLLPDGSVTFEVLQANDLEDFGLCGSVSGYFRRVLQIATMSANGPSVELLAQYEVTPASPAPVVKMFQIADDGHGGRLVPWTVQYGDTPAEPHLARFTTDGRQDFALPVASDIVKLNENLGAMIDGQTLVVFDLVTGEKKWARVFPKGDARILPAPPGTLIIVQPQGTEILDETGRSVQRRPQY